MNSPSCPQSGQHAFFRDGNGVRHEVILEHYVRATKFWECRDEQGKQYTVYEKNLTVIITPQPTES